MGNRPSQLETTQYCGLSASLGKMYGVGRPAKMSAAFHAQLSDDPHKETLLRGLTEDELAEIATWPKPDPIEEIDGVAINCTYENSYKEVCLAMDENGEPCDYNAETRFTRGKMDFGWCRTIPTEGGDVSLAIVSDMKKTRFTTSGPDNLQNLWYGLTFAAQMGCDSFVCGLWIIEDKKWVWGQPYALNDFETVEIWAKLKHAIENVSDEGVTGAHCRNCYARLHCKEHLVPLVTEGHWLAPLAEGSSVELTNEVALQTLLKVQAVQDFVKSDGPIMDALKEFANRNDGIKDPETGKRWRPINMKGKESVNPKYLRQQLGDEAEQYFSRGAPYSRMGWTK